MLFYNCDQQKRYPVALSLSLLGSLTVTRDDHTLPLPTRKAGALLAYLALHPDKKISRDWLATLLWPESRSALPNLRAELVRLRRAIGDNDTRQPLLGISRHAVILHSDRADIDVQRIGKRLNRYADHQHPTRKVCPECREHLAQAVKIYHAPLLQDFAGIDSPEFENWLAIRREALENRILSALEMLEVWMVELGDHPKVIEYTRHHLTLRPGLESQTLRLMTALTLSNARSEAIAVYESLHSYLKQEFAVEPDAALTQLYHQIRSRSVLASMPVPAASPYPGLAAFGTDDSENFYGRELTVKRLVKTVCQQPIVLLTGASGSGKSSVVQAGLLPALVRQMEESQTYWSVVTFRPGWNPLIRLAQSIAPTAKAEGGAAEIVAALLDKTISLRQVVRQSIGLPVVEEEGIKRRILLVVDQFEEIFTLCGDEAVRRLFLSGLFDSIDDGPEQTIPITVLLALRADFMGQALSYRAFSEVAQEHVIFLGAMSDEQLRRVIEEPARQSGIVYEPGLIQRILRDLDDSPGQLPLLQFALTLLWQERKANWITHAAYDNIEQVSGALTHYADGVYASLTPAEQKRSRRIFLQLVHPGEGVEDTRRLALRSEIGEGDWPLIHRLASARLVVTNQDRSGLETVEVIHEALIQQWKRLREWLQEDRVFHIWQSRVWTYLRIWQRGAEDADALLRGSVLAEAERWLLERQDELEEKLVGFIQASLQARQQREESERQRNRELELALAESQRLERRALARQLGAQADQLMMRKSDLGLLLTNEALQRSDRPQERTDLMTTLNINPFLEKVLHGHTSSVFYLNFGADGKTLISSDERNTIQIWRLDSFVCKPLLADDPPTADDVALDPTGHRVATVHGKTIALWEIDSQRSQILVPDHQSNIFRLRFSMDGDYLLSISVNGELSLWESQTALPLPPTPALARGVSLQVGPQADLLAAAEDEGGMPVVHLYQRTTGALLAPSLRGHREMIHGLALSPDGSRLATASFDGTVRVWETETGRESTPVLSDHTGRVLFARFSPDGRWLATGGTDNLLLLWDAQSGERLNIHPFYHSNWVRCAAFSADGKTLASGDSDGKIYLWDLSRSTPLPGHTKRVRDVAVSPDGRRLATISFDGTVGVWDTERLESVEWLTVQADQQMMAGLFSPDGTTFAAVDSRGQLLLWETATWQRRDWPLNPHNEPSIALAFSPDSRLLAQGDLNGYVSLWDVGNGELIHPPTRLHTGLASWVLCLAFSPDGAILTTGSKDRTIAFWSVDSFAPVGPPIEAHANWVTHLLYTADGSTLISTSSDGSVRFWNPQTGEENASPLTGHAGQIWQAELCSLDGKDVLVTLGGDGSVLWWDWASRTLLAPPLRTDTETEAMALSPDGKWLYLGSFDKNAYAWKLPQGAWLDRSRGIANRSLTAEERQTYLGQPDR